MRILAVLLALAVVPGAASAFEELEFIVGHWSCEALGGTAEEIWPPAHGDAMHGVFRLVADGTLQFSEFVQVTREDGLLVMRFAHFRRDYTTWEEAGSPIELELAGNGPGFARFTGRNAHSPDIEYRLGEDGVLEVRVTGLDAPFRFRRVE